MNLPFTTQTNGKPNHFIEKIWCGEVVLNQNRTVNNVLIRRCMERGYDVNPNNSKFPPKIHTIRRDKTNKWKPGYPISMWVEDNPDDWFQFAPIISVVSIQKIEMVKQTWGIDIIIDDFFMNDVTIKRLIKNDGFESLDDFIKFFFPPEEKKITYKGKIIHWTGYYYNKKMDKI